MIEAIANLVTVPVVGFFITVLAVVASFIRSKDETGI